MGKIKEDLRKQQAMCDFLSKKVSAATNPIHSNEDDTKGDMSVSSSLDAIVLSLQAKNALYERELSTQQQARAKEVVLLREAAKLLSSVEIDRSALEIKLRESTTNSATQIASLDEYIRDLQGQLHEMRREREEAQKEANQAAQENEQLKSSLEELHRDFLSIRSGASSAADELLAKQAENAAMRRELAQLRTRGREVETKLLEAESQLEVAKQQLGEAKAQGIQGAQDVCDVLEQELSDDGDEDSTFWAPAHAYIAPLVPLSPKASTSSSSSEPAPSTPLVKFSADTRSPPASGKSRGARDPFIIFDPESPGASAAMRIAKLESDNDKLERENEDMKR